MAKKRSKRKATVKKAAIKKAATNKATARKAARPPNGANDPLFAAVKGATHRYLGHVRLDVDGPATRASSG